MKGISFEDCERLLSPLYEEEVCRLMVVCMRSVSVRVVIDALNDGVYRDDLDKIVACFQRTGVDVMNKSLDEFARELQEAILYGTSVSNVSHRLWQWIAPLQHYHDSTVGLWATDRPDLVIDEQGLLFQLTAIKESK